MSRTFDIMCNNCGRLSGIGHQSVLLLANSLPIYNASSGSIKVVWDLDGYKCPVCKTVHLDSRSSELVWKATGQEDDIPQWILYRKFGLTLKPITVAIPFNPKYKDDDVYDISAELRPFVDGPNFNVYSLEIPIKTVNDREVELSRILGPGFDNSKETLSDVVATLDNRVFQQFATDLHIPYPSALKEAVHSLKDSAEKLLGDVNTSRIPRIFNHRLNSTEPTTKEISDLACKVDRILNIDPDVKIKILAPESIEGNR